MKFFRSLSNLLMLILPATALAEVSDKIATIPQVWLQCAIVGVAALFAGWYRFALGLALTPISLFFAWAGYSTLADRYIGLAIIAEQGTPYVVAVYGSALLMLALHAFGLYLGWRRGRYRGNVAV